MAPRLKALRPWKVCLGALGFLVALAVTTPSIHLIYSVLDNIDEAMIDDCFQDHDLLTSAQADRACGYDAVTDERDWMEFFDRVSRIPLPTK